MTVQPTEIEQAIAQTFDGWDPHGEGLVAAIAQAFANYRSNVIAPFVAGAGDVAVRRAVVTVSATNGDLQKARQLWAIVQEEYIADAERAIALALAVERDRALAPIREMGRNIEAVIATTDWSHMAPCAGVLDSVVQVIHRTLGTDS